LLKVEKLSAFYGEIEALKGIFLEVAPGELISIIGANGAGKSTLLKCLMGSIAKRKGEIFFEGTNITNLNSTQVVKLGITLVPEGRQIFGPLSLKDNLVLGAYLRYRNGEAKAIDRDFEFVYSLFPVLSARRHQSAETMSGGEQQMLALGRAIMARPKLLLVEQNAMIALNVSARSYVIETGRIVMGGMSKDLLKNKQVKEAYFGEKARVKL
jgi:branched-chain amino acid transport system ATP-binding protein